MYDQGMDVIFSEDTNETIQIPQVKNIIVFK